MMEEKTLSETERERKGHFPIYGWFLTGNCIDRQSGLQDAQTGQEEGDNTEESTKAWN